MITQQRIRSTLVLTTVAGAILVAGLATATVRHASQHRYGDGSQPLANHTAAIAALEPIGAVEGWGRVMVRDQVMPDADARRHLSLRVCDLEPETDYTLLIDGITVAVFATDAVGDGSVRLGWPDDMFPPVPDELPPAETLILAQITDASLAVALEGEFVIGVYGGTGPADTVYMERIRLDAALGSGERGIAKVVRTDDDEQRFESRACSLEPGAVYQIVVDGLLAGAATADPVGYASIELSTADGSLGSDLQPIEELRLVEWIDGAQEVVLTGSFAGVNMAGSGNGGSGTGGDPGTGGSGSPGSGSGGSGGSGGNGGGSGSGGNGGGGGSGQP